MHLSTRSLETKAGKDKKVKSGGGDEGGEGGKVGGWL